MLAFATIASVVTIAGLVFNRSRTSNLPTSQENSTNNVEHSSQVPTIGRTLYEVKCVITDVLDSDKDTSIITTGDKVRLLLHDASALIRKKDLEQKLQQKLGSDVTKVSIEIQEPLQYQTF